MNRLLRVAIIAALILLAMWMGVEFIHQCAHRHRLAAVGYAMVCGSVLLTLSAFTERHPAR